MRDEEYRKGQEIYVQVCETHGVTPESEPPVAQFMSRILSRPIGYAASFCRGNPGLLVWLSVILETHARIARDVSEMAFDEIARDLGLRDD